MLRRTLTLTLAGIMLFTASGWQLVHAQTESAAKQADKARSEIQRLGSGKNARVEIKLLNNRKVKGFVSATNEDSCSVTDAQTGATQTVAYADVQQVKKPRGGLSVRTWAIIGAAAVAVVIVGVTVIKPVLCDGC